MDRNVKVVEFQSRVEGVAEPSPGSTEQRDEPEPESLGRSVG